MRETCPFISFQKKYNNEINCMDSCAFHARGGCLIAIALETYIDKATNPFGNIIFDNNIVKGSDAND